MLVRPPQLTAAARDLPIGTRIRKIDIKQNDALEKDLPKGALFQDKDALDRALLFPVSAHEALTNFKLAAIGGAEGVPATIDAGMRAISVQINDSSGVAGLIQPNSRVDVMFNRPGSMAEAVTSVILQNVKVLAIGRLVQVDQTLDPKAPKMPVVTLVERNGDARSRVMNPVTGKNVRQVIEGNVKMGSRLMTDGSSLYDEEAMDYVHEIVDHSAEEWVRGNQPGTLLCDWGFGNGRACGWRPADSRRSCGRSAARPGSSSPLNYWSNSAPINNRRSSPTSWPTR